MILILMMLSIFVIHLQFNLNKYLAMCGGKGKSFGSINKINMWVKNELFSIPIFEKSQFPNELHMYI